MHGESLLVARSVVRLEDLRTYHIANACTWVLRTGSFIRGEEHAHQATKVQATTKVRWQGRISFIAETQDFARRTFVCPPMFLEMSEKIKTA